MDISIEFPFLIGLSPAWWREVTSEVKQKLYHFDSASPLIFIQRELFNILLSESRLRHKEIYNKGKIMMEFNTGDLVLVRIQVKSTRKDGVAQKLSFKTKGPYRFLDNATPSSYWLQSLPFCEGIERPGRKVK